jgi:peptidoglycan hydrolase-like protein with peptidoglycan-binding domain
MSAISDVLWPGMKSLEPKSELGGIYANKRGYHNKRQNLPMPGSSSDYSVDEFSIDRQGPSNEASAIDWTFPDAQGGDYKTISKYSKRLYAVRSGDSRTVYMREFFGQIDNDRTVEGWDYSKNRASSSDSSHLWHIHISIHRKYINSTIAMRAILSILKGQTEAEWKQEISREVTFETFSSHLPVLKSGDSDPWVKGGTGYVSRAQRQLGVPADGDYGPQTVNAVKALGIPGYTGKTIDLKVWTKLFAMWDAAPTDTFDQQGAQRMVTFEDFTASLPILKSEDSDDAGGIDGSGTEYVKRVQKAVGVTADGEYGPATIAAVKAVGVPGYTGKTVDHEVYSRIYALWNIDVIETKKVKPRSK